MPRLPYIQTCKKCGVQFHSPSRYRHLCGGCRKSSAMRPRIYYKNRKIVFDRDEMKCQCCGCTVVTGRPTKTNTACVHHIDCDKTNNSLSNLILLCTQCHGSLHKIYDKHTLRVSNIYKLFAKEKRFGEFGKINIYSPAKQIVKKQFGGKPKKFFNTKK